MQTIAHPPRPLADCADPAPIEMVTQLRGNLGERMDVYPSRGVIIDVTGHDVIDSSATRTLPWHAHLLKLRGTETVSGIRANAAFAMVEQGLTRQEIGTALDREERFSCLDAKTKRALANGN